MHSYRDTVQLQLVRALRAQLGRVYGWMLEKRPFGLWVAGVRVTPRRHCVWDSNRTVGFGRGANAEEIPAYTEIDCRSN